MGSIDRKRKYPMSDLALFLWRAGERSGGNLSQIDNGHLLDPNQTADFRSVLLDDAAGALTEDAHRWAVRQAMAG